MIFQLRGFGEAGSMVPLGPDIDPETGGYAPVPDFPVPSGDVPEALPGPPPAGPTSKIFGMPAQTVKVAAASVAVFLAFMIFFGKGRRRGRGRVVRRLAYARRPRRRRRYR